MKPTVSLVKLCHAGAKHKDEVVRIAADAVLSYTVLHLRQQHTPIPDELAPYMKTLEQNVFTV